MSQENVEAVRLAIEEFNEGELGARFNAALAPNLHFRDELGTLDSRDDLRAYLETFRESFGGLHIEIEQVRDLGDTILFVMNQGGQGTASGIDIEQHFTWVMTFDRNVCVRWLIYADHEKALEAAGLRE
jgi:ketosteroid isomerase-like protein